MKLSHKILILISLLLAAIILVLKTTKAIPYGSYLWLNIAFVVLLAINPIFIFIDIRKDLRRTKGKNELKNKD